MSAAHLCVRGAAWAPGKRRAPVLYPTSFDLAQGRVMGVVGPNGAGKSTLLRLLYRYQAPTAGQILINGTDIWQLPARQVARQVAAVLQEQAIGFGLNVQDIISLGRTPHKQGYGGADPDGAAVIARVIDMLDLRGVARRDFGTLSGGERQRVMVARALAQDPQILILDEPTNHLDIRHQLEVLALIRQLGLTIVVSLHDLNMAAEICDDILMLDGGQQRGFGDSDTVLTEQLVSSTFRVTARQDRLTLGQTAHLSFHLPTAG